MNEHPDKAESQMNGKSSPAELYLELIKKILTRTLFSEAYIPVEPPLKSIKRFIYLPIKKVFSLRDILLVKRVDLSLFEEGREWPFEAETMIGMKRLDNLHFCINEVLDNNIPGDLIEAGVWRGGASIFMRAAMKAYGDTSRILWVADSFEGLPKPDADRYPEDLNSDHWRWSRLAVPLEEVRGNFEKYGLLDNQVCFLKGWFKDTLTTVSSENLSILRLDGDMYQSTLDALNALYPKLSVGGFVIIDDYGAVKGCRAAVDDYRSDHGICEELIQVDWGSVYWQRSRP